MEIILVCTVLEKINGLVFRFFAEKIIGLLSEGISKFI